MKINKPGKETPSWIGLVITCDRCECEFELEAGDRPDIGWRLLGMCTTGLTTCPSCGCRIEFPATANDLKIHNETMNKRVATG